MSIFSGSAGLGELIQNLFSRSVTLPRADTRADFKTLCRRLLSNGGDVAALQVASAILRKYETATDGEKDQLFEFLGEELDIDAPSVASAAQAYAAEPNAGNYTQLQAACEAPRQELLRRLNRVPGGTIALVRMREDLMDRLKTNAALGRVDADFRHLFTSWFNRGFLVLQEIDWSTSAELLEKVIRYEAVHHISSWDELRRRLEPADRRCFAFFHPAIPNEPLIFVEVALTGNVITSIDEILQRDGDAGSAEDATVAVFYSISNCQKGLAGVSFGNLLIKQVAGQLRSRFPNLREFVTLSPVPGLTDWLEKAGPEYASIQQQVEVAQLQSPGAPDPELVLSNSQLIAGLAAYYLLHARRDDGRLWDPVARFHLANGASLDRIDTGADLSPSGLARSFGVMVNYRYDLASTDANQKAFFEKGTVRASGAVRSLAEKYGRKTGT